MSFEKKMTKNEFTKIQNLPQLLTSSSRSSLAKFSQKIKNNFNVKNEVFVKVFNHQK
jgi:hypothetical protein